MDRKLSLFLMTLCFLLSQNSYAKNEWPRDITTEKGTIITLYQPQLESLKGDILKTRVVVSVKKDKNAEPIFGVFWSDATLNTDLTTRIAALEKLKVTSLKFPDGTDPKNLTLLTELLQTEIPKWNLIVSIDEIVTTLEEDQNIKSDDLSTKAPPIYYVTKPSTLILIDGNTILKKDEKLKMEKVVNTPFLIVKSSKDKKFYLYSGKLWYSSEAVDKGWKNVTKLPKDVKNLNKEIQKKVKESAELSADTTVARPTDIIVSTKPAELIQSDGEPKFASIEGTGLLYISNSPDNIFKVVDDQKYYILVAGRWYNSKSLNGPWTYNESDKLPADFAKIPEGSEKDVVLANVAGTDAAKEAVKQAQIPQTAKVNRKTAKCTAAYDGSPKFEAIKGTDLEVAINCSVTVLHSGNKYYAVDNGVWFVSDNAAGPWAVSTERPKDVDKIPPDNQAYNAQYVEIYDVTPDYVYMGYTPGYMGCYVYGPTVVYGTGFYYNPWYGSMYYPYPVTYGYGMCYNPYMGWSMGFAFTAGIITAGIIYGGHYGGYWGPPMYHPPYYHYPPHGGHYPPHGGYPGSGVGNRPGSGVGAGNRPSTLPSSGNNLYGSRAGVSTRDVQGAGGRNQVSTQPARGGAGGGNTRPVSGGNMGASASTRDLGAPKTISGANNVYSDRSGNIYRNDGSGNWQQRSNNSWNNSSSSRDLDRSSQARDRGNTRSSYSGSYGGSMGRGMGGGGGRGRR
jgi:hypothetical protein